MVCERVKLGAAAKITQTREREPIIFVSAPDMGETPFLPHRSKQGKEHLCLTLGETICYD